MVYKLYLKSYGFCYPHVIASRLEVLPNAFGGLRSLRVGKLDTFWTGIDHLHFSGDSVFDVQLSEVKSIYRRSSLDEDDEPWEQLLAPEAHPTKFHYEVYASMAEDLERVLDEGKRDKSCF